MINKKKTINNIIKLEDKKSILEDRVNNQKILLSNSKRVKNITIYKSVVKLVSPIVISSLVLLGVSTFGEIGKPFVLDKEKCSKVYYLECEQNSGINTEEYYDVIKNNKDISKSTFTITTSWIKNNDHYERNVYNYQEQKLTDIDLYNSIISHDIDYIYNNYEPITSNVEVSSYLKDNIDNKDNIVAKIYIVDSNDNIYIYESKYKNNIVTLLEILVSITASTLIILGIKDGIILELRKNISKYDHQKELYNKELTDLNYLEEQLSNLKSKVKKYEK